MLVPFENSQPHPAFSPEPAFTLGRIRRIIAAIADLSCVTEAQLVGEFRGRSVCHARHAAMWCARQLTDASLPDIGRAFGGRDHTTVLHAVRMFEQRATAEIREDLLLKVCQRTGIQRRAA